MCLLSIKRKFPWYTCSLLSRPKKRFKAHNLAAVKGGIVSLRGEGNFHPPPQKDSWNKHCDPVQFVSTTVNKRLQLRLSLVLKLSPWMGGRNVRRILVRGSMPLCRQRQRKFRKFDYEIVHSEVYLNKYVVCIAPFSTPACHDCSQKYNINIENCPVCMFPLFNFSYIFQGVSWPHLPLCADAHTNSVLNNPKLTPTANTNNHNW